MIDQINLQKKKQYIVLILFYFLVFFSVVLIFKDFGIQIEEKFHRMNGLYWLHYIAQVFDLDKIFSITDSKMILVNDYTMSKVTDMNKYGIIFDMPLAFIEIIFGIQKMENIYHSKHILSFFTFLVSSFFFFKILIKRFKNFFISFIGTVLFITTPRIFGDSFFYNDVLFLSFFNIALYFFLEILENSNTKNLIYFALFSAIAFNLRVFGIMLPVTFFLILIIKSFNNKKIYEYLKFYSLYLITFFGLVIIFSPYLWSSPFKNFIEIFTLLRETGIITFRILFNNEFVSNQNVPASYLITWILISTPIFTLIFFSFGYISFFFRFLNRFTSISEKNTFNDLWRGNKEQKDFIIFFLLTAYYFIFALLDAPLHNGWRLVYFLNIFIIYFSVYSIDRLFLFVKKSNLKKYFLSLTVIISIIYNITYLIIYHPYQSYYFNELISNNKRNTFEIDYHGLGAKEFFLKLTSDHKGKQVNVGVASFTPLHRGLEGIDRKLRKTINMVGQDYKNADFIYKNNISEVNFRLNKKYKIPNNFDKVYELKINGTKIYEIYKKIK